MTKMPEPIIIDFETEAIQKRPHYPPKPVSVSLKEPGKPPQFWAWGHPVGNNCTKQDAKERLRKAYQSGKPLLFHNEKFDIDVGETHMNLPRLNWERYHDTMFLAFLDNPDRSTQSLKPLSEEVLRRKPRERDAVRDWIIQNIPEARAKKSQWGAYISRAPGQLVAPYGKADTTMPEGIFRKLYPKILKRGMGMAYDRERRIMLPLLDSERAGIRVDYKLLRKELPLYEHLLAQADKRIRKIVKSPELDVDKGKDLANAMEKAGIVLEHEWIRTKPSKSHASGQRSTGKKALMIVLRKNKKLLALLLYRNALATSIRTFMRPWLETALETQGWIHTTWNQVRTHHAGGDPAGARTGRLSSTPNFQNIPLYTRSVLILPKLVEAGITMIDAESLRLFKWATPKTCPLPMMKKYILPDAPDEILIERDYSQQEFRILAHFEDGALLAQYQETPEMDVHDAARDLIFNLLGIMLDRRPVKDVGFSIIYGMGLDELARKTETTREEAGGFKRAYLRAMPGLADLIKGIKHTALDGDPIITWGGRQYFVEEPRIVDGRIREFFYKLINRLVQGSAADCTKESLARYSEMPARKRAGGKFKMTVHDSNVISAPKATWRQADAALRWSMESVEFDVKMLTDGKHGKTLGTMVETKD